MRIWPNRDYLARIQTKFGRRFPNETENRRNHPTGEPKNAETTKIIYGQHTPLGKIHTKPSNIKRTAKTTINKTNK